MNIPSKLVSGDSISWDDVPSKDNLGNAVDSSQYTLSYVFKGTKASLSVDGVTQGSGWRTTISTTQSALLVPGIYYWQAYASKTGARVTLGSGQLDVKQNLSVAPTSFDGRSQAEQDLDAVQLAMRTMIAGGAVQEYTIGTRSLKKMTLTDLMAMESQLKAEVAKEKQASSIANGLGNPKNVFVRFT